MVERRDPACAWLVAILLGTACGGGRPPPEPPPALDPEEEDPANVAGIALPALPLDVEPEDLGDGWAAAERALTMPAPAPPTGEAWEVDAWADDVLAEWIERRASTVTDAQRALARARDDDAAVSVVASALLGLVYSRFAFDLRGIPTPAAFAADAERAAAFREALDGAARPLWQRALDAFGSCSSVAADAPAHVLSTWRERCDAELRLLTPLAVEEASETAPSP